MCKIGSICCPVFFLSHLHTIHPGCPSPPNPPHTHLTPTSKAKVEELEHELIELNANSDRLRRSYNELLELQLVIDRAGMFFDDVRSTAEHFGTQSTTQLDSMWMVVVVC